MFRWRMEALSTLSEKSCGSSKSEKRTRALDDFVIHANDNETSRDKVRINIGCGLLLLFLVRDAENQEPAQLRSETTRTLPPTRVVVDVW